MWRYIGVSLGLCGLVLQGALAADSHSQHWGYHGTSGPEHWAELAPEFALCQQGTLQSPIDLAAAYRQEPSLLPPAPLPPLEFLYRPVGLALHNNGHTLQQQIPADSGHLVALGKRFELVQIHFHAPSEHQIRGQNYPVEAHLVHRAADGELAVVGVFLQRGAPNPALQMLWLTPPPVGQTQQQPELLFNPLELLPRNRSYYFYLGSLTTPPCTEGVRWFVLRKPITASESQILRFTQYYSDNARPPQPLHRRRVSEAFQPTLPLHYPGLPY